jgi:hypothetical protein
LSFRSKGFVCCLFTIHGPPRFLFQHVHLSALPIMNGRFTLRHVITRLVSGPLYQEETDLWFRLRTEAEAVRGHYHQMGLDVVIDEEGGFAFLRQAVEGDETDEGENGQAPLPRLLRRTPLSYHQTLLAVLLRERLLQHDQSGDGEAYLYFELKEIIDLLRPYFPDSSNEKKIEERMARTIARLVELGILRKLKNRTDDIYRVEPILRAKLPVEQIREIRNRLRAGLQEGDEIEQTEEEGRDAEPTND